MFTVPANFPNAPQHSPDKLQLSPASSQILLGDLLLEQTNFYGFSIPEAVACISVASPAWRWRKTQFILLHFSDTTCLRLQPQVKPA